jgi:uncharacterized membrane protein
MTIFGYIVGGICVSATLIAGLIFKFAPPKKINNPYGFRTDATLRNQETWEYGHRICANLLIIYSFFSIAAYTILLVLKPTFLGDSFYVWFLLGLAMVLIGIAITTIITQKKTNKFYDKSTSRHGDIMAFCDSCGTQVQEWRKTCSSYIYWAQFQSPPIGKHGKQVDTELTINIPIDAEIISTGDIEKNKDIACSAYILIVLPLLAAPDSRYVRFHVNQSMILLIAFSGAAIILDCMIHFQLLTSTPQILAASAIFSILWLLISILGITGVINAHKGRVKELPIIGRFRIVKTIMSDKPGFWTL